jgi:transcriptional regulator with XRE-family HTH domain
MFAAHVGTVVPVGTNVVKSLVPLSRGTLVAGAVRLRAVDDIAQRIRDQMERQDLSARALSLRAGLSERHVGKLLERGAGSAETETLMKIAAALGVSITWLLLGAGAPDAAEPVNDQREGPTMGRRPGFDEALDGARLIRPTYPETLWQRVAAGEPLAVIPMTPQLVAEMADILLRLAPPQRRK